MRSHKKFRAKKMIFRGVFRGGLSERKKSNLAFGVPVLVKMNTRPNLEILIKLFK